MELSNILQQMKVSGRILGLTDAIKIVCDGKLSPDGKLERLNEQLLALTQEQDELKRLGGA